MKRSNCVVKQTVKNNVLRGQLITDTSHDTTHNTLLHYINTTRKHKTVDTGHMWNGSEILQKLKLCTKTEINKLREQTVSLNKVAKQHCTYTTINMSYTRQTTLRMTLRATQKPLYCQIEHIIKHYNNNKTH